MKVLKNVLSLSVVAVLALAPDAWADSGMLIGTFKVRCPAGHDDIVEGITRNHDCETCDAKSVDSGKAMVVCPIGHATQVALVTRSHRCTFQLPDGSVCGKECKR